MKFDWKELLLFKLQQNIYINILIYKRNGGFSEAGQALVSAEGWQPSDDLKAHWQPYCPLTASQKTIFGCPG